ncbi:amidohydrolase [Haladaptatus pallidirubidus]|uniref:Peptidase M20 domain-containing protein 2 n=1 Tax=Haladaptatus pallidirubidus TaxID=1008152 RepID=A0AAV3UII0_9EURY|nr:amidohydrolase [Haladaptatus pallidirubidus]
MTDTQTQKEAVCTAIDDHRDDIIELAKAVEEEPELGYKEHATTDKVTAAFETMGLEIERDLAITGARASTDLETSADEFTIAVLGELDALVNWEHPKADPETGACHACGHHAQLANLIGTAYGLSSTGILDRLHGTVEFIAVPAEEYLDLEYRRSLVNDGKIEFLGGKQELIKRGYFDHVDCAAMIHADADTPEREILTRSSTNGFIGKFVTYRGRSSHAGAAPEEGVNALNAAMLGMNAVHAQRETFADEENVRVHPILTKGGEGVNVVPADVRMESYTRAKSIQAVNGANDSVNRALESGAMAVGADISIEDYPGYLPFQTDKTMIEIYETNAVDELGSDAIDTHNPHTTGSTDMGDITQIIPGIHPMIGGFEGTPHTPEFQAVDDEMAYIIPAKLTACMIVDLLANSKTKEKIRQQKEQKYSPEDYLTLIREMRRSVTGEYLSD